MLFLLIAETVLSLALLLAFGIFGIGVSGKLRIVLGVVLILAAVTLIIAGRSLHIPFPHLRFRRAR